MIEDIQKINKLAQELLNQGIVEDRTKAVEMAEAILRKKVASVKELSESGMAQAIPTIDVEQLKMMFDRTKDFLQRQIDSLKKELEKLGEEIKAIREKVDVPIKGQAVLRTDRPQNELQKEQESQEKIHPKVGKFTPEDVSIEKMFYYGDKNKQG